MNASRLCLGVVWCWVIVVVGAASAAESASTRAPRFNAVVSTSAWAAKTVESKGSWFDDTTKQYYARFRNGTDNRVLISVWNNRVKYSKSASAGSTIDIAIGRTRQDDPLEWEWEYE